MQLEPKLVQISASAEKGYLPPAKRWWQWWARRNCKSAAPAHRFRQGAAKTGWYAHESANIAPALSFSQCTPAESSKNPEATQCTSCFQINAIQFSLKLHGSETYAAAIEPLQFNPTSNKMVNLQILLPAGTRSRAQFHSLPWFRWDNLIQSKLNCILFWKNKFIGIFLTLIKRFLLLDGGK